jgi:DNA oxidative demethylase
VSTPTASRKPLTFRHITGALSPAEQADLLADVQAVLAEAPPFRPTMPRTGRPFSVAMSNCGSLGWVSDRACGYRYQATHPVTGRAWPAMPERLLALWRAHACCPALPEACLVNLYDEEARMGSHQDRDEADFSAPVVSISLGDDAVFHVGGTARGDRKVRMTLRSGDVLVLEGESRLAYHGVDRVRAGTSLLLPAGGRINLTLRRVSPIVREQ